MAALGLSPAEFIATYSQVLRITPTRPLGWHGRTTPRSVRGVASIDEPVRTAARRFAGEPMSAPEPRPAPVPPIRVRPDFGRALRSLFSPPSAVGARLEAGAA
jgi:hypothetical protein